MKLIELIQNSGENWKEVLEKEPYCFKIQEKSNLVLFLYNQIKSDFSLPEVREARGVILEKDTWKVVARGFDKFFNIQEEYADEIDWETALVQEKVDGSIIKFFYYNNGWNIATNGTINAFEADLPLKGEVNNFGDLVVYAFMKYNFNSSVLDERCTYIFEVVSPYNRVVVPYTEIDIYHLGTRNNETGRELNVDIGIPKPKTYNLTDKKSVMEMANTFDFHNEGFVVVDAENRRVKVKSEDYVRVHRLRGEDIPTPKRLLELHRTNEVSEFLSYFPEYQEQYDAFLEKYNAYVNKLNELLNFYEENKNLERKEFALKAKETSCPSFLFGLLDNKWSNAEEYLEQQREKNLIKVLYEDK